MEMLASGEYTLASQPVHGKSILFVKLTDSAQRALATYLRALDPRHAPHIEFTADAGRLLIPASDGCVAQFKFDVCSNDTMQGKQGRFECVQRRRGSRQLLKCGQLTHRLRVHANEDVYETTKNRMAAIELQQRQNCTVQLDWQTTKVRHLKPSLRDRPPPSNMIRNHSRPVNNAPPKKASLVRRPLRERIVHLLALRPYRRPELEAALRRDGLRDCERAHIVDTLVAVGTFRDNAYHLSKHAWSEVRDDWPAYNEHERQLLAKNRQLVPGSPGSSDSGVSVASNSPNQPAGSPPQAYKRPGYFNGVDGFQTKRQRISHFVKQEPSRDEKPAKVEQPKCADSPPKGLSEALQLCLDEPKEPEAAHEKPKYMKDYVTITNTEQRARYKADFSSIFAEYERVHKEVDRVRNLFAQLGEQLREHKKGTRGYAKVEHDILTKYYALKSNRNFQDAKRRYEYLHEKLSHIKNLVNEYDDKARKQM